MLHTTVFCALTILLESKLHNHVHKDEEADMPMFKFRTHLDIPLKSLIAQCYSTV